MRGVSLGELRRVRYAPAMNQPRIRADVIQQLRVLLEGASKVFFPEDPTEGLNSEEEEKFYQATLADLKREEAWLIRDALQMVLNELNLPNATTTVSERISIANIIVAASRIILDLDGNR